MKMAHEPHLPALLATYGPGTTGNTHSAGVIDKVEDALIPTPRGNMPSYLGIFPYHIG